MPTIAFLKAHIQNVIAPSDEVEFLRLIQEADIRLTEFVNFRWTRSRLELTPVDGVITLPATHASILAAQVGSYPTDVFDETYEFTPGGVGEVEVGTSGSGSIRLIDQGLDDAGLRVYKVTGVLPVGTIISVLANKAPVTLYDPDIADSDVPEDAVTTTLCPDMAALKLAALAIVYEEANDMTKSREYFATAISTLNAKEKSQRGGSKTPINVRPNGPGIRKIQTFR